MRYQGAGSCRVEQCRHRYGMFIFTLAMLTVRAFKCLYLYKADKKCELKVFLSWDYF